MSRIVGFEGTRHVTSNSNPDDKPRDTPIDLSDSMFKLAARKIAHNSTLPVLGGNKDLRTLQELITAEKAVLQSYVTCGSSQHRFKTDVGRLQKLSNDIAKASEALKAWGVGEGVDLWVSRVQYKHRSVNSQNTGYALCIVCPLPPIRPCAASLCKPSWRRT